LIARTTPFEPGALAHGTPQLAARQARLEAGRVERTGLDLAAPALEHLAHELREQRAVHALRGRVDVRRQESLVDRGQEAKRERSGRGAHGMNPLAPPAATQWQS
jgi:hypothetical protein